MTFDILPGITGLLGPNGAGKTTLLRMMTGLAATSSGTVTVFGEPVRDNPPLYRRIGVMSEHETVYGFMKGREFVRDDGRAARRARTSSARSIARSRSSTWPTRSIARWTRTRAACASACGSPATLVHDPELLILDEPLNGADPRQRVHFKHLLQQLAAEGRTIVLSSHILEEVEQLADTVLLIVNGKLAASGGFRAIRAALNQRPYHVRVICDAPRALAVGGRRARRPWTRCTSIPMARVVVLSRNVLDLQIELPRLAQAAAISLRRVEPLDDSLESVFGYLVES